MNFSIISMLVKHNFQPTIQNPKIFHLQCYKTEKRGRFPSVITVGTTVPKTTGLLSVF